MAQRLKEPLQKVLRCIASTALKLLESEILSTLSIVGVMYKMCVCFTKR